MVMHSVPGMSIKRDLDFRMIVMRVMLGNDERQQRGELSRTCRTGFGQEATFACAVGRTFRRWFYPGNGRSIRDVERCFIGRCRLSPIGGCGARISGCALRITIYRDHLPGNGTSGIGCQKDSERRDIRRIHETFDGLIGERCRLFLRDGAATG